MPSLLSYFNIIPTIMKKTIIALMALACSATADSVDFTSVTIHNNLGGFGGVDFSLSEDSWLSPSSDASWDYSAVKAVTLDSITLSMYGTWYTANNMTTGFGIGIYEKTVTGDSTVWTLVGKSDWLSHTSDSYQATTEINVQGSVTLSTDKTYTMAFHAGQNYLTNLEIGSTRNSMAGATEWKGSQPSSDTDILAAVGLRGEATDSTGLVQMYKPGDQGIQTGWTPNIVLSVTPIIPEPATATLSLLALAGLAARRRRSSH